MSSVGPIAYPPELPISARRDDLLAAIRDHQVVVVAGETGSGKTTQLPKLCLELGRERIAHTQPRRLAARTVAQRIADELKVPLGGAVGYAVRFSDRTSAETRIRLVTDGLLLAEIRRDRELRRYDTIIIDEAHDRSLNVDFLLGYVKRLLPRRPDLKLIVTSATIDPEQFSRHYGDAPIIEVSGRTYPVEVRYRPVVDPDVPESERDPLDAIGEAVEELQRAGPGDILVFLSGEREIRDAADHLRGRLPDDVELLPLYARLATGEQQRVFKDHQRRRVVLATNVAETSLTVPGIRYVIDPGTARISRYSARLKVQRLPIERVSQASADQRKGRCGRTSDGICIRLYTEDDYDERPRFTDPEILRTNLASVILQMAALRLGAIEDFPFLDPPDGRQVRDGVLLLQELGALDADQRLTKLGRRLARLPLDPRLGRMVLEADRRGCAHEVVVIAAALSIQDPRERPSERREAADRLHARFADERSDLIGYLNLWRYVHDRQRELSGSAFRRLCRDEHLHFLRIREWQDLVGQLRTAARELDVKMNRAPAEPDDVHVALLAGLLSHLGMRDAARREYQGARGARFAIFPGSSLAKAQPNWVMAAELVETSRLWGREVARIEPAWVEPLAEHLARRTYSEPRWDRRRGSVVATERVTVYGLPIVAGRTVAYGRIDPVLSRELFIGCALVERDWDTRHAFFAENGRLLEEIDALEQRERRRDLLVGDDALFAFFDARVPDDIVSGAHFDRWWRDARRTTPDLLTYTRELLIAPAAASVDGRGRPESWRQGDVELALSYRFEPGSEEDGVTVHVPLKTLPQLREQGFDWLVPAFREELVTALIRSLPKELRRPLVPVPEVAAEVVAALKPRRGRFPDAVARELERLRGVRVPRTAWDLERLPAHLRVTFRVEDDDGELVAEGKDLAALRAEVRPRLRAELSAAAAGLERTGLREWSLGDLPRVVALPGTGQAVRGYPALVDEGETVAVRVLDSESAQQAAMRTGTRRLLALTVPSPARAVTDRLSNAARLALATAPHGTLAAALDDAVAAATDALVARAGGPAWDAAGFARLRAHVAGELADATADVLARVVEILDAAAEVRRRLQALPPAAPAEAREDVARQVGRLVYPGFVTATGAERLPDVVRYLRGAERRLERLPAKPAADLDRMRTIHELEGLYRERRDRAPGDMPWLLEELRVSQFAQGLGTRQPVSVKRLRRLLDEAG